MILYPTETTYGLGVHALDSRELEKLYRLKGRDTAKAVSWLVRNVADIERYVEMSDTAAKIAERFLPGPLTLVLPLLQPLYHVDGTVQETIGFRISSDPIAQALIEDFMEEHDAPLTSTSANKSGMQTEAGVDAILAQFAHDAYLIERIIDDGPRLGTPSTVVRIIGDVIEILREGQITKKQLSEIEDKVFTSS
jgi:L-threonylcarbamoyladenylate synthase